MTTLTKKNLRVFEFLETYQLEYGRSPTYREIMTGLRYKSPAGIQAHLDKLEMAGWIQRGKGAKARSIRLLKNAKPTHHEIALSLGDLITRYEAMPTELMYELRMLQEKLA